MAMSPIAARILNSAWKRPNQFGRQTVDKSKISMSRSIERKAAAQESTGAGSVHAGWGLNQLFSDIAQKTSREAGRAWVFVLAFGTIVVWGITGPLFGFSDTWQLVI